MNLPRLSSTQTHAALSATVAAACIGSLLLSGFLMRDRAAVRPAPRLTRSAAAWRPWAAFLVVCGLLLANQLVVNAYILQVHGGDPHFVTRYLGRGWFTVAPWWPVVRWLAASVPEALWHGPLAYSLLRVQAVLELPFALLAYLCVVALLDVELHRRLCRSAMLPLAAIVFTFTFCLIELRLYNPWTRSDVWARLIAAAAVILWWAARRRTDPGEAPGFTLPTLGISGLLLFFIGAAAVGAVVLVLYDVALLYNLGHLPERLPILAAGLGIGWIAALGRSLQTASATDRRRPQPGLAGLTAILVAFTAVFFVPSLTIRYCGEQLGAVGGAGLLFLAALLLGLRLALRQQEALGHPRWHVLFGLLVALASALGLLYIDAVGRVFGSEPPIFELLLLENAALVLPLAAGAVYLSDRLLARAPS